MIVYQEAGKVNPVWCVPFLLIIFHSIRDNATNPYFHVINYKAHQTNQTNKH